MRIGLFSPHFAFNYGAVLQAFALKTFLIEHGYDAVILNRRPEYHCAIPSLSGRIARKIEVLAKSNSFGKFEREYLQPQTELIVHQKDWSKFENFNLDAVIVGSDQIWRDDYCFTSFGYNLFLDFITDRSIKKISYAPSLGKDSWNADPEVEAKVKMLINDFSSISVREKSSVDILKQKFGVDAELVLDPTMLLTKDDYRKHFKIKKRLDNYIATYILDYNDELNMVLSHIGKDLDLKIHKILIRAPKSKISKLLDRFRTMKPVRKWVSDIANAKYVITNSFHGMVFSIIFRKQFVVIMNKERGAARFKSLLSMFGLENRLLNNYNDSLSLFSETIDYSAIEPTIDLWRNKSIDFLVKSLSK